MDQVVAGGQLGGECDATAAFGGIDAERDRAFGEVEASGFQLCRGGGAGQCLGRQLTAVDGEADVARRDGGLAAHRGGRADADHRARRRGLEAEALGQVERVDIGPELTAVRDEGLGRRQLGIGFDGPAEADRLLVRIVAQRLAGAADQRGRDEVAGNGLGISLGVAGSMGADRRKGGRQRDGE